MRSAKRGKVFAVKLWLRLFFFDCLFIFFACFLNLRLAFCFIVRRVYCPSNEYLWRFVEGKFAFLRLCVRMTAVLLFELIDICSASTYILIQVCLLELDLLAQ